MNSQNFRYHFNNVFPERVACLGFSLYQFGELLCAPGPDPDVQPHRQKCYELTYVLSGSGKVTVGKTEYAVREEDCILSLPGEEHLIVSDPAHPLRFAFLGFDPNPESRDFGYLFRELDRIGEGNRRASLPDRGQLFYQLFSELKSETPFRMQLSAYLIAELLISFLRSRSRSQPISYSGLLSENSVLVYEIRSYIEQHLYSLKNLAELETIFNYNYRYLAHCFDRITHQQLNDFFLERKMRTADQLLRQGHSITDVAALLNYSSIHSFSRSYKNHFGYSPSHRPPAEEDFSDPNTNVQKGTGQMKIGVITNCLKQPLDQGLETAAKLGLAGVQIYATTGSFSPDVLSAEDKKHYQELLRQNGLVVSAFCGDMGGYGFEQEENNGTRVEKTKRIIDLAAEFGTQVVTTHIGVIPEDKSHPRYAVMLKALTECGKYAMTKGVTLAIETGPEKAATLKAFLDDTKGGIGVNLDPANFTMVTGQDAVEAVHILGKYIVHTHLKDGKKVSDEMTPEEVYHAFAVGGVDALNACKCFEETPIGIGAVDFKNYLKALHEEGFDGFLTIEREAGAQPIEDIRSGIAYIREVGKEYIR